MFRRTMGSRLRKVALACIAVLALATSPFVTSQTAAQAAPVAGFNAGNIISDSAFYNGNAMSAAEVQGFLNQKVPRCTIGDVSYKMPGSVERTQNPVAANCLKDLRITTQTKAANAYCGTYVGAANETAALIIAKVGQACGISQKVLLVMLEKEQSLVTDSWPTVRMFNYAMGWGCPDSGPGNTANCDSDGAGFAYQVYQSAWQFKVYKASPNRWNFKAHQTNTIQWHPNAGCGTSQVYVENSATAALYIYTPYRPNQAALNAGWGTGDGCSSYGNRNFYLFYTTWFGSVQGFEVTGDFETYWLSRGAEAGIFGVPTGPEVFVTGGGGGRLQNFSGGVVFRGERTNATVGIPFGGEYGLYNDLGGYNGILGWPTAEIHITDWGFFRGYDNGYVAASAATVASVRFGPVYEFYNQLGGFSGLLGIPTGEQFSASSASRGIVQSFKNGLIVTEPTGDNPRYMISGPIYDHYNTFEGGLQGSLGLPTASPIATTNGTVQQDFTGGRLIQLSGGEVVSVKGEAWKALQIHETENARLGSLVGEPLRMGDRNL
ncbi:MAG: hypothetical protein GX862_08155, partial [Leucobacter sp.]|nr:hypothetical protein [Leucobacter sp.]